MPTVITVERNEEPISGEFDLSGSVQAYEDVSFRVQFAESNATTYDAITAKLNEAVKVPEFGDKRGAYVLVKKSATQLRDPFVWIVKCHYRIPEPTAEPTPAAPTTDSRWGIRVEGRNVPYQEEMQSYLSRVNGKIVRKALVTVMGDVLAGVMDDRSDQELLVTYKCVQVPWDVIEACENLVNDATVPLTINGRTRTILANQMKLMSWEWAVTIGTDTKQYPEVTLRFGIRKGEILKDGTYPGWTRQIVQKSFYYKDGANNKTRFSSLDYFDNDGNFVAGGGTPSAEPWPIDRLGKPVKFQGELTMVPVPALQTSFTNLLKGIQT